MLSWESAGVIDFDNSRRTKCHTRKIPFIPDQSGSWAQQRQNQQVQNTSAATLVSSDAQTHTHTHPQHNDSAVVSLAQGSYLVEFNELVDVPLDLMGQIFVRSSLFRAGALISAGLMDSGYKGAVGGMLQVTNPHGLRLYRNAKLAQIVFHRMTEEVVGYNGQYQGAKNM
ncbi:hypothetical protein MMC24_003302 [Lignoscripta atroalba]|nr:hypothetical protein [Lignoscripta atroalba]